MKITNITDLQKKAYEIRMDIIRMLDTAGSGHVGGPLGMADIFTALYFNIANVDGNNPENSNRDYILLSNGHICPVWYVTLAHAGYFDKAELNSLRKIDSLLQGHPKMHIPGVENSSGPLGHGLSQAVGIALGLKRDNKSNKVFCLTSDGEHQEGQTWEAVMSANKWQLDNLVAVMDWNGIQIEGTNDEIMPLGDLEAKYQSFGWNVLTIDGHSFDEILSAFKKAESFKWPTMILAKTTAGKGVSYMEGKYEYHDWKGKEWDAQKALHDLQNFYNQL